MSLKIYHQCGHFTSWNKEAFEEQGLGDGLIFSPVHEHKDRFSTVFSDDLKNVSFFDPQFYLPNSTKVKLESYEFFPETVSGGFATADFSVHALEAARGCLEFQLENNFDRLVIPARFHEQLASDFCGAQSAYTVVPFLTALSEQEPDKEVFLTLPVTQHMILDPAFRSEVLNWVTSYPEIDGIYLIISFDRQRKQITSSSVLRQALEFVNDLMSADLKVVVGYCNSENILFSLLGDIELSFGAYENTRMFSLDKFLESDTPRRGPRARIFVPGLLNWIQLEQAKDIRERLPDLWAEIHISTDDSEAALESVGDWAFNKKELYRHHFFAAQDQIGILSPLSQSDRHALIRQKLLAARDYYENIEGAYIDLDLHGSGEHIQPWLDAINGFASDHFN